MAFDERLAERVREALAGRAGITEKRMFGGIAFLLDGNMATGVIGDELIVRLGPDAERALAEAGVREFDFTGRPMRGWVVAGNEAIADERALAGWVEAGADFAASLPPK